MQKEVLSRINSATAASGDDKRCDTTVVLAFDEITIKGKYIIINDS